MIVDESELWAPSRADWRRTRRVDPSKAANRRWAVIHGWDFAARIGGSGLSAPAQVRYRAAHMAKEEKVEFEGEVVEALPNAMFRVKLDNDHMVLGHVAGKMRRFRIRILPGDRVRVELSPYDLDRARIVYRHR